MTLIFAADNASFPKGVLPAYSLCAPLRIVTCYNITLHYAEFASTFD